MDAREVGRKLVDLYREGEMTKAVDDLYAETVVSVEADTPPGEDRAVEGIDAVREKQAWWRDNHELHSVSVDGPFHHGEDRFAAVYRIDATYTPDDDRNELHEVAVYTVRDGKIVREEFFYAT